MKTIIFDIDGTITDMWPIERSVLLHMTDTRFEKCIDALKISGVCDTYTLYMRVTHKKISKSQFTALYNASCKFLHTKSRLPIPRAYPLVRWMQTNCDRYNFVYATGGQQLETLYVLSQLGLTQYVDSNNSIDKTVCRRSKKSGVPFIKIKAIYSDCLLISDSTDDCLGAYRAKIPYILVKPGQKTVSVPDGF